FDVPHESEQSPVLGDHLAGLQRGTADARFRAVAAGLVAARLQARLGRGDDGAAAAGADAAGEAALDGRRVAAGADAGRGLAAAAARAGRRARAGGPP